MSKKRVAFAFVVFAVSVSLVLSCTMNPDIVSIWGGDLATPKLVSFRVLSGSSWEAVFSAPVTGVRSSLIVSGEDGAPVETQSASTGTTIVFNSDRIVAIGVTGVLSATVKDGRGNTLSFSVPVTGFNDRVPKLLFNEIRTEYSKPKVEFIELYACTAGNLSGVVIWNPMNTVKPLYEFPAVEVMAGELIVYHLRTVEEGLIDETGPMDASAGTDSRSGARDFWDNQTKAPLKKNNALLLRERIDGPILDALLVAESSLTEWPTDAVREAAEAAVAAGSWMPGSSVTDAFCSTGTTVTRTMGRNVQSSDTGTAMDWKICATSKCTPGETNTGH